MIFNFFYRRRRVQDISNKIIGNEKEVQVNDSFYEKFNVLNEAFRCISCFSNYMNYSMSCGHLGICSNCYDYLKSSNSQYKNKCMICRKKSIKYNKFIIPFSEVDLNYAVDFNPENMLLFKKKFSQLEKLDKIILIKENEVNNLINEKEMEINKYESKILNLKNNIVKKQIDYDYYEDNLIAIENKFIYMKVKKLWIYFLNSLIFNYNLKYYDEKLLLVKNNYKQIKYLNLWLKFYNYLTS
jgi:hypothetical protein